MKYTKRFLALFLALCMMLTSVPLNVNATEGTPSEVATEAPAQDDDQTVAEEETSETVDSGNTESTEKDEEDSENVTSDEDVVIGADQSDSTTDKDSQDTTLDDAKPKKDKPDNAKPGKDKKEDVKLGKDKKTEAEEIIEEVPAIYASRDAVEEPVTYVDTDGVVDAAIVFTDAHTQETNYKESNFKAIFGALKNTGLPFSSVTSGGDAFSVNNDSGNNGFNKYTGLTGTLNGYIREALGNSSIPVNYVWSDHDRYAVKEDGKTLLDKTSRLVYGAGTDGTYGTDDDGNYYVYILSMGDLSTNDRYSAGFTSNRANKGFTESVEKAISNFEADVDKLKKDRPLLIVSHQPLLANRGDNGHAAAWCDAINDVAEEMDVAFFFGHNHKYDKSSDYYYAKGSEMPVAQANNDKTGTKTTLNFTHMCAGYMSPQSSTSYASDTRMDVAVAVAIYEDSMKFTTYDKNGVYTGGNALNVEVGREFATAEEPEVPETPDTPETPEDTEIPEGYVLERIEVVNQGTTKYFLGDSLDAEGLNVVAVYTKEDAVDVRHTIKPSDVETEGYTISGFDGNKAGKQYITVSYENCIGSFAVEVFQKTFTNTAGDVSVEFKNYGITSMQATSNVKEVEGFNAYVTYDITPVGYTQGDEAAVTVTVDTNLFDVTRPVNVLDKGVRIASPNIVDGKVTFITNHFSEYDVVQTALEDVEWKAIPGETKTIFRLTDTLENGKKYLIVNMNVAGDAKTVNFNGSRINSTNVKVIADGEGNYIEAPATSAQWNYTSNNYFQSVKSNSSYLRGRSSTGTLSVGYYGSANIKWSYDTTYGLINNSDSNSSYNLGSSFSLQKRDVADRVYIYVEDEISTSSTYVTMTGTTVYNISVGQYANEDAVLDMIRNNIDIYLATKADKSDAATTEEYTITGTVDPMKEDTYTLTVKYGDVTLGTVTVSVVDNIAQSISVNPMTFTVERDTPINTTIGTLTVKYSETDIETVDLTIDMLQGTKNVNKNGTYSDLSVSYAGKTIEGLTLKVVNKTGVEDFPTYPNPGAVDLKKTATGIDFQNTGVARVELSASGLPAEKGVDVVIVIDTSSSMRYNASGSQVGYSDANSRYQIMKRSLRQMLTNFKAANPTTGVVPDIDIAIIDFNGYGSSTYIDNASLDDQYRTNADNAKVYTVNGDAQTITNISGGLTADHFMKNTTIDVDTIVGKFTEGYSGTNYDGAFQNAYDLLAAKQVENAENNETREQYVIFMSDGASFRYNGFMTGNSGNRTRFDQWLDGIWKDDAELKTYISGNNYYSESANLAYLYNGNGTNHPHRMAEAIKGDPNQVYDVVLNTRTQNPNPANEDEPYLYQRNGLGAKIYSIGFCMQDDTQSGTTVHKETLVEVIKTLSSGEGYYIENATDEEQLTNAFNKIVSEISIAASNARYVDQMGSSFNLQMNPTIETNAAGSGGTTTVNTAITITTHPIYKRDDVDKIIEGHTVTPDDIGKPYGNGTIIETVSFEEIEKEKIKATTTASGYTLPDGTLVTANSTDILKGGIICGKNFFYNTTTTTKPITLANGTTYDLPAETFYWNIGTINEVQYTMAYTVYLDGALDGAVTANSYETNNFAILYYTNHEGNEVNKAVASPSMAWKGAQVSYAFYLVDGATGKPVHADGTEATNFLQAYKVTQPVVYKNLELNKEGATTLSAAALAVLPQGYELYAPDTTYTVSIGSGDGQGANQSGWSIVKDNDKTTYVMGYKGANDYSNAQNVADASYDYTHTTVYFAVKWIVGAVQDTVVIDYGLDVEIDVMANDMFGKAGKLVAVGDDTAKPSERGTTLATGFLTTSVNGTFGTATITNGKVRYALDKSKGMQMNGAETFAYAVDYDGSINQGFYYGDLTIIPATTVYYEDEYVTLKTYKREKTGTDDKGKDIYSDYTITNGWASPTDSKPATEIQAEDRPGQFSLGTVDANNIYGFDSVYENMSTFSMDNAAMIHVDAKQYGTAEFEFYGTGFDVISATSNKTGTLVVQVFDTAGKSVKAQAVNTYYGYEYGLYHVVYEKVNGRWTKVSVGEKATNWTGEPQTKEDLNNNPTTNENGTVTNTIVHYTWKPVENNPNALYQIPVMKVDGLTYGKYKVKISALYYSAFDSTEDPGYDIYLDALRIYNPAGTTSDQLGTTIEKAYAADGELFPSYYELRNLIIEANKLNGLGIGSIDGIAFIDGNEGLTDGNALSGDAVTDYTNYGPNNELYLAYNQSVAFEFSAAPKTGYYPVVRLGMKTVGGTSAMAELWNVSGTEVKYNTISKKIDTATDMYYDISVLNNGTIVITNTAEGSILSVTNVKVSYRPIETSTAGLSETSETANAETPRMFSISRESLDAALLSLASVKTEEPEIGEPETEKPEANKPEINEPETEVPEVNEPETEESETTILEETIVTVVTKIVNTVKNVLGNLFGRWFR